MDPLIGAGLISAGSNLLGGVLRQFGEGQANDRAADLAANNMAMQQSFAKDAITWRARDAMRAYGETGIHPLQLIGAPGATYSPVSAAFMAPSGIGEGLGRAGQDISRSISAQSDRSLRERALNMQEDQMLLSRERMGLENELLRTRIESERARLVQSNNPPIPSPGDDSRGVEKNIFPDVSISRHPSGGFVIMPSEAAQQRMSEMFGLSAEWFARNRAWFATEEGRQWAQGILPKAPYAMEWKYDPGTGRWYPSHKAYEDRHMFQDLQRARGMQRWRGMYRGPL